MLLRFAECVQIKIKGMAESEMGRGQVISDEFSQYLAERIPVVKLLAEISVASVSNKTLQQELQGLLNRLYRVISEEFQAYMTQGRFKDLTEELRGIVSASKLDWPTVSSRSGKALTSFMPAFSGPITAASVDEGLAEFMLRLVRSLNAFDNSLLSFFSCGQDLVKPGDKQYQQFLEICL